MKWLVVVGVIGALGALIWFGWPRSAVAPVGPEAEQAVSSASQPEMTGVATSPTASPSSEGNGWVAPVDDFRMRVTKKPFGINVTPENSPVQPERFAGFHTGADVEYEDVADDVSVMSAADGTVLLARVAGGYGGVVAIQHVLDGREVVGIYGHLRPSLLPVVGKVVTSGEQIGVLGKGGTSETDGERRHLHFGLVKGTMIDLRGYVESESALYEWIDPLTVFDK